MAGSPLLGLWRGPTEHDEADAILRYLEEQAEVIPASGLHPPSADLRLCIVIPALAERSSLPLVIDSLSIGSQRLHQAEIIVVVNNSRSASPQVVEDNLQTIVELQRRGTSNLALHVLDRASEKNAFPDEIAGVGAARRVGLDLALRRLAAIGNQRRSALACLDADSPVAPGYVDGLLEVFDAAHPPLAGICSFEHSLPHDRVGQQAIVVYETWLRYIEAGFRFCGSPYAFQTIGSCTVVSPAGYALADGMPRRKAGEDFYMLQKIAKVGPGKIVPIDAVTVFPSARVSDRVPFGTGRAMRRCHDEGLLRYLFVEPPSAYLDLRRFYEQAAVCFDRLDQLPSSIPERLARFIQQQGGPATLRLLRENTPDPEHFLWAVHTWFDSLQMVRYANRCKKELGGVGIYQALREVLPDLLDVDEWASLSNPDPKTLELDAQLRTLELLRRHGRAAGAP